MAKNAAKECGQEERLIIGSVGPYGQGLRNGATYTGHYPLVDALKTLEEREKHMVDFHLPRLNHLLDNPDVDVIGIETIPRVEEAVALARHMVSLPAEKAKPYYIALVCRADGKHVGFGEPIEEAVKSLAPFFEDENFWAFGINCVSYFAVPSLLDGINKELSAIPVGKRVPKLMVYPNSGEVFSFTTYKWTGQTLEERNEFALEAEKWVANQGVSVIGGCCRINAPQIKLLTERLNKPMIAKL